MTSTTDTSTGTRQLEDDTQGSEAAAQAGQLAATIANNAAPPTEHGNPGDDAELDEDARAERKARREAAAAAAVKWMSDTIDSFTGYDEQAIEERFGKPIEQLDGSKYSRAVWFGHLIKQPGAKAGDAYKTVMGMRAEDVGRAFLVEAGHPDLADE